jgi:hypothetical protein
MTEDQSRGLLALFLGVLAISFYCGLLGYLCFLVGFAIIMASINHQELMGRARDWRAARKSGELRKTA